METVSLKDAAERLHLSIITLRRYIKEGRLKAVKVGRAYFVGITDLDAFIGGTSRLAEAARLMDKALNDTEELHYQHSRVALFVKARDIYRDAGRQDLTEKADMDVAVFNFLTTSIISDDDGDDTSRKRWGRFAPTATWQDKDGKEYYSPDPASIDQAMLDHAQRRVEEIRNPLLLARYYDLLFDRGKDRDKRQVAYGAIQHYRAAAAIEVANGWDFEFLDSIIRAFEIAVKIGDQLKAREIIHEILSYVSNFDARDNPRFSLELIRVLLRYPKLVTGDQLQEMIAQARRGSAHFLRTGNRHLERMFLHVTIKAYRIVKDAEAERALRLEEAHSFIAEAEDGAARGGLVEAHSLERAVGILYQIKDPRNEIPVLRRRIEDANLRAQDEMRPISAEFSITEQQRDEYVRSVLSPDLAESLQRIGALPQLVPSYKSAEELTAKLAKDAPLQHILGSKRIQDGRRITSSPGGFDVTEDHVIENLGRSIGLSSIFLGFIFDEWERRGGSGQKVADYLRDRTVFRSGNFAAVEEGLRDYDDGRYFSALSVLVPQLEEAMRSALRSIGHPTLNVDAKTGNQQTIHMKEIVESWRPFLTDDQYWYFRLITYDKRGMGLRDTVAHGLLKHGQRNRSECHFVVQLLLILAAFEIQATEGNQHTVEGKSE